MFFKILLTAVATTFVLQLVGALQTTDVCPPNLARDRYLQVRGDFCYQFVEYRKVTHSMAQASCERNGGTLALIKDQATQNYIHNQILNTYGHPRQSVWIGLTDITRENHFVWDDGTVPVYTHWDADAGPGSINHALHDCVVLDMYAGGKWRDIYCDTETLHLSFETEETHVYICQYPIQATSSTSSRTQNLPSTTTTFDAGDQITTEASTQNLPSTTTTFDAGDQITTEASTQNLPSTTTTFDAGDQITTEASTQNLPSTTTPFDAGNQTITEARTQNLPSTTTEAPTTFESSSLADTTSIQTSTTESKGVSTTPCPVVICSLGCSPVSFTNGEHYACPKCVCL
ncbi:macrophage mannose receptor 1 isoform X1 [Biomphalaria glabrata]|nr:macrophage mannose receptor 1 isoform X1 [Biomphalaria glabrata]